MVEQSSRRLSSPPQLLLGDFPCFTHCIMLDLADIGIIPSVATLQETSCLGSIFCHWVHVSGHQWLQGNRALSWLLLSASISPIGREIQSDFLRPPLNNFRLCPATCHLMHCAVPPSTRARDRGELWPPQCGGVESL
jgi:hypothetical protein